MIAPLSQGTSILRLLPQVLNHMTMKSRTSYQQQTPQERLQFTHHLQKLEHNSTKPGEDQEACHWTDWL